MPRSPIGRTSTVLLISDHPRDAQRAYRSLAGVKRVRAVHLMPDSRRALDLFDQRLTPFLTVKPQVILIDLSAPGHDGIEIMRRLQQHPRLHDVPVLVLTSSRADTLAWQEGQSHASVYLVKPDGDSDFTTVLRRLVEVHLPRQEIIPRRAS